MCVGAWAQNVPSAEEGDEIDIYGNFGKAWDKFRKLHSECRDRCGLGRIVLSKII